MTQPKVRAFSVGPRGGAKPDRFYQLRARALVHARRDGDPWAVVEIDDGEDRVVTIMPYEDTRFDEFLAFDGVVLEVVE